MKRNAKAVQIGIYSLSGDPLASSPRSLLHVFPAFAVGGAQRRFGQLLRAFGQKYNHQVLSLNGDLEMASHLPPGAPVTYPKLPSGLGGLAKVPKLRQIIRSLRPDVLVTYNWGAIEWAFANRFAPLVRHVHIEDGFGPEERMRQLPRRVWFRRLALGGAHTTLVLPSHNLVRIATEQWRLSPAKLRYIANGIDCDRFETERAIAAAGPLRIGTVAALRPEKNIARLIGAVAQAKKARPDIDWRLMIVGDGPQRGLLEKAAKDHAIAVTFTGPTETPEKFLAQMDIFALSSDTEQMPLGVLEAMASGLPVVSTDVGDVARMVAAEGAPFVTALDDPAGLSQSLIALAADAPLRARLGQANRRKVLAEYDYRMMASHYEALFD